MCGVRDVFCAKHDLTKNVSTIWLSWARGFVISRFLGGGGYPGVGWGGVGGRGVNIYHTLELENNNPSNLTVGHYQLSYRRIYSITI